MLYLRIRYQLHAITRWLRGFFFYVSTCYYIVYRWHFIHGWLLPIGVPDVGLAHHVIPLSMIALMKFNRKQGIFLIMRFCLVCIEIGLQVVPAAGLLVERNIIV